MAMHSPHPPWQKRPPPRLEPPIVNGRVPPHDLDAEAAVLSAILLSREALDRVLEILKPEHFYSDANGRIYAAAQALALSGTPIDIVSVASYLRDREQLAQVGGAPYVAQLADATPAVAHVGAHAQCVYEKWRLRAVIATCQRVAAEGYGDVGVVQEFIDGCEQDIYQLARTAQTTSVQPIHQVLRAAFKQITEAADRGDRITGISTGYEKLDAKTAGLHAGDLMIIAARPGMGKTSFALCLGVNVASPRAAPARPGEPRGETQQETGYGVCVFSLEMPREQLAVRMVCSEGRVDVGKVRQGMLGPEDWRRLTEAASYLSSLPLWIDDTSALGVLELRAKVRRIQADYNREAIPADPSRGIVAQSERKVGLVIVDYLQLMKGRDGVSNREQEISEISRGLKQLAKELKVPVIALSQLNRAVETRTTKDKRPQLSDLRECMVGGTLIPDPITGELVPLRAAPRQALGLDAQMRARATAVVDSWSTGKKPTLMVTTGSGRRLRCTGTHPLRTINGWRPVGEIPLGTRVAVPRAVPEPLCPTNPFNAQELRLLGYLISGGHYGKNRSVGYSDSDRTLVEDVRQIARGQFGIKAHEGGTRGDCEQIDLTVPECGPGGNPLINWLRDIEVHGQIGDEKRVPAGVWRCANRLLAVFVGALWAGGGSVVRRKGGGWTVKFPSTSMGLLDDVQWALTRLGIIYSRGPAGRNKKSTVDIATIAVTDATQILRFAEIVPVPGRKGERLARAAVECAAMGRHARIDRLPIEVTDRVATLANGRGISWAELGYRCQGGEMCRADLARVADALDDDELRQLASSDVLWDTIVSVEPAGEAEVYDLRAPATANVVANGFFAHNSGAIEQDADAILFIYRDEYYHPETTTAKGIAEILISKQRNGPTGKILTRFTASCTRFDTLAPGDYQEPAEDGGPS